MGDGIGGEGKLGVFHVPRRGPQRFSPMRLQNQNWP